MLLCVCVVCSVFVIRWWGGGGGCGGGGVGGGGGGVEIFEN